MALAFDPINRRIVLDDGYCTAAEVFSRWEDWAREGDNLKWPPAFRQVGGDDLGSGLSIPPYFFLINGWRIRPMEANHDLEINGNIFVDGGVETPVVPTIGQWQVNVKYVVAVQAQAFSAAAMVPTAAEIAAAVAIILEPKFSSVESKVEESAFL